jgi:hypothetical protein
MSVVFSNYLQEDSNKNGYFRIGTVVLNIPPTNIITEKIINNNRKTILRGKNEMFTKSGQSRWDVTVTWKSILSGGQDKYSSWEDLQTILAMFKVAPFVEVESPHLRQIFAEKDPKMSASRLAFGLRYRPGYCRWAHCYSNNDLFQLSSLYFRLWLYPSQERYYRN